MATYGKTLREEIGVSDGAEEDYILGSPNIKTDCKNNQVGQFSRLSC
jgi:hypothetical protein